MAKVTLTATFPAVERFGDYHDIQSHSDDLNKLFKSSSVIRNEEVAFSAGGLYWGVFYVGRKPAKAVIYQLLADAGFEPSDDEDDDNLLHAFGIGRKIVR